MAVPYNDFRAAVLDKADRLVVSNTSLLWPSVGPGLQHRLNRSLTVDFDVPGPMHADLQNLVNGVTVAADEMSELLEMPAERYRDPAALRGLLSMAESLEEASDSVERVLISPDFHNETDTPGSLPSSPLHDLTTALAAAALVFEHVEPVIEPTRHIPPDHGVVDLEPTMWDVAERVLNAILMTSDSEQVATRRVAVDSLDRSSTRITKRALEVPNFSLVQLLEDETVVLDPHTESYLRSQLDTIQTQMRTDDGDRFIIERAIALIVGRLLDLGHAGDGVRSVLEALGAEPQDLVDEMVNTSREIAEQIASDWGRPHALPADAADALVETERMERALAETADDVVLPGLASEESVGSALRGAASFGSGPVAAGVLRAIGAKAATQWKIDSIVVQYITAIGKFIASWVTNP